MELRNKEVGNFKEPIFIAEIGQNHNGNPKAAKELIEAAKKAGCDYAKFQCWDKRTLFIRSFYEGKPGDEYLNTKDLEETLDLLNLSSDELKQYKEFCKVTGIGFSSTPVSKSYIDLLVELDVDFIKIASFDLNNLPLLRYAASKGKPIVLSTGLSTLHEIEEAVNAIYAEGNRDIVLLHCVAVYPPKDENINLNNIDLLRDYFGLPVGFSDHTVGFSASLAAIAKGACMIEKHFTLDNSIASGDHPISADPEQMQIITTEGRRINKNLGQKRRKLSDEEQEFQRILRRSIVSAREIKKGETITEDMIDYLRPGTGIQIQETPYVLNRKAARDIENDRLISWDDLE